MCRLIASLVCAFAIAVLGPPGLQAPARAASFAGVAAPAAHTSPAKKKRPHNDDSAARRAKEDKLKKAKDKHRGFEF
jgi:hypothetical protein